MNQNNLRTLQFNLSGVSGWLTLLAIAWLLGSLGLGWIVKSLAVIMVLLIVTPIIAVLGFRWWLQRNVVESQCPVCHTELAGINGTQLRCPNCSEPLQFEKGMVHRITPPGTVDVQAIEVPARQIED